MDGFDGMPGPQSGDDGHHSRKRQVLAVRMGRGRTGGSTLLDWLIQCARRAGREVAIGDGDRRNPTLAALYPPRSQGGATQPQTDETPDVKDWITSELATLPGAGHSLVLDLGGGDRVLSEYGRDLGLIEFCLSAGIEPLALFVSGPEVDDFEHVLAIWRAGYFATPRAVIVFNEHLIQQGRTPTGAFDSITSRPEIREMILAGVEIVYMPRLPCMAEMRKKGLSFLDAIDGKPGLDGTPLDPVRKFMVQTWHKKMVASFEAAGAWGWLP